MEGKTVLFSKKYSVMQYFNQNDTNLNYNL